MKKSKNSNFFRYSDYRYIEVINAMVGGCVELQIVGSESIPEANKYVSEFGKGRDKDNEEKVIDSMGKEQSVKKCSILEVCIYFLVKRQI